MAAARYRAFERRRALFRDPGRQAPDLGRVGRAHLEPDLAGPEALEQAVRTFDDCSGSSGRGQAGDDELAGLGHFARRGRALCASCDEVGDGGFAEVADHEVDAVTQQVARERRPEVAEPDDADPEFRLVRAMHLAIVPEFQYKT